MIVCVCHQVSDRDITREVRAGREFSDIQLELGVATQCGRCEGCAREVVREVTREVTRPCQIPVASTAAWLRGPAVADAAAAFVTHT